MLQIILAILAFGFLVIVHEFGHFITAKKSGVQVNEFWVGMGPTLLAKEWHGTRYCLKLLPFGGACVMEGEDGESDNPHSFGHAALPRRMLVVVAGALMNFLAGFLLLLLLYAPARYEGFSSTTIDSFFNGFTAQGETMLMPGDEILKIDGYRVLLNGDVRTGLSRGGADGQYDIVVRRDGEVKTLTNVPLKPAFDNGSKYGINFTVEKKTPLVLLKHALYMAVDFGRLVWDSLGMLVSGQAGVDQLSGPVGVAGVMAQTVRQSWEDFILLVSFISINLGVMNLLPLPALDGGRLLFLIIEAIRHKPVPPKYEGYVHAAGLALLMLLMLYVTGQDILRLLTGS